MAVEAQVGEGSSSLIDLAGYHQNFLRPLVQYIFGKKPGPIRLIEALVGPHQIRRVSQPELRVISGGVT